MEIKDRMDFPRTKTDFFFREKKQRKKTREAVLLWSPKFKKSTQSKREESSCHF